MFKSWHIVLVFFFCAQALFSQKIVRYDLYVGDTIVNFTGKKAHALAINGQIPAPALVFTEGDTAEIYVHNTLKETTSLHWHGLILPNRYDGVPYLTTAPILPNSTHLYRFALVQNGTYWYHSHTMLQEQSGLYGALIVHKKNKDPQLRAEDALPEIPLLLSDWTNENPMQIDRSLHNATDWYGIKKGAAQSYGEAIIQGHFKTKLTNEWKRMLPMDVSDVYYDRFLANGQPVMRTNQFKKGDRVRFRIINGSASTYFWLQWAGGKITVVANDGKDVEPVEVDRMIIAVSETYDIVVTLPEDGAYELRATSEDRTKFSSVYVGKGADVPAPTLPRLQYFEGMRMMNGMMRMNGTMDDMGMQMSLQQMDMNTVMYPEITGMPAQKQMKGMDMGKEMSAPTLPDDFTTLHYTMLRATESTVLSEKPTRTMYWKLTGNMNRYVWTIDNRTVSESDKILIKKGENIRIILYNGSMMRHPMHLHGHFFRLLNGQGAYAPLKNVLDIMPMETDTIEFNASEIGGNWFFHCHILYHMMSGMGRIFTYENSAPNPELPNPKKALRMVYHDDRKFHSMAQIGLESNGSDGEFRLTNTRWLFQTEWRLGLNDRNGYESESHIGRYLGKNQFFVPYVGWDYRYRKTAVRENNVFGQLNTKDIRRVFCVGLRFTLPMFLVFDARMDQSGKFRLQIGRDDLAFSKRLRGRFMLNSDREWMVGARYIMTKYWAISSHYDSDMGLGVGVTFLY
jgi:CopA family copper-resistance protein